MNVIKKIFFYLVLSVSSLNIISCANEENVFDTLDNQDIPQNLCGTYYQLETEQTERGYYPYITIHPDGIIEGIYISDGQSTKFRGMCYYKENKLFCYHNTNNNWEKIYGAERSIVEWTSEYLVLGRFTASILTRSKQKPEFIGKEHNTQLIGKWEDNQTSSSVSTYILNEKGFGSYEFSSQLHQYQEDIAEWFTFNEWLYLKYNGEPDYTIWRYYLSGKTLYLYYCDILDKDSKYNYHKKDDISESIIGKWEIYMDDPSWKVTLEIKENGEYVATDWYDIEGDNTFSEKDGTWSGTYSLTTNGITFSETGSVITGSYTFSSISSIYFTAKNEDGWKIYATK